MQSIQALIEAGLASEIQDIKELAIEARSELISWQTSKGVHKEQNIRAAIRNNNQVILNFVNDPNNKASDLKKRFEVWAIYNMGVGYYGALNLQPPASLLKAIYDWELKVEGLEVYHTEVIL
jgi:hypothetical protein